MNKIYESTRDKNERIEGAKAILQGLSSDGGLFVLSDLTSRKIDLSSLVTKSYYEIAQTILEIFLDDFTKDEIVNCVANAYENKFTSDMITPLVKLKDAYVLELFHGPTSAFKDVGLSLLPQLVSTALKKTGADYDILILTATSGDTGKAALEGFKDVDKTKIMVFYPNEGVSKVQETQMKTQQGSNVLVCAIEGNFDDAQSGIKKLFVDTDFKEQLAKDNIHLSSANSINIGRLIPQMVYYFSAYANLVKSGEIKMGDKVNYIVPTGNFGNILAGYYAKQIGLPVHKLVCASNENNVLYDFFETGEYNRNRDFLKTSSPSMDILISSNLERLLYYASGCDNVYIKELMEELNQNGSYKLKDEVLQAIRKDFMWGYATSEECTNIIKQVYEKDQYLLDPHTAVAYKVLLDHVDKEHKNIVLSTASPYKFAKSVVHALYKSDESDEFEQMKQLYEKTQVDIPINLQNLNTLPLLHNDVIKKEDMKDYVKKHIKEI